MAQQVMSENAKEMMRGTKTLIVVFLTEKKKKKTLRKANCPKIEDECHIHNMEYYSITKKI